MNQTFSLESQPNLCKNATKTNKEIIQNFSNQQRIFHLFHRSTECVAVIAIVCTLFLFLHTKNLTTRLREMENRLQPSAPHSSNEYSGKYLLKLHQWLFNWMPLWNFKLRWFTFNFHRVKCRTALECNQECNDESFVLHRFNGSNQVVCHSKWIAAFKN